MKTRHAPKAAARKTVSASRKASKKTKPLEYTFTNEGFIAPSHYELVGDDNMGMVRLLESEPEKFRLEVSAARDQGLTLSAAIEATRRKWIARTIPAQA